MQLNINEIEKILPHRYPFLLVDRIEECVPGESVRGIKCVTANEQFFCGHFPGRKVMPGVLILEALAQVGAVAILTDPAEAGRLVYFGGVKKARFKAKVEPGDVLELECRLTERRGPLGFGQAVARVNGRVAAQAELSFAVGEAVE